MHRHKLFPVDVLKKYPLNNKVKRIILVVPGNPGLVNYYANFIEELHKEVNDDSTAVWAMSHSCHSLQKLNLTDEFKGDPLDLEIEHKLRFLETEIPPDCRIHLVGHSIGCYMILSVLQIMMGMKNRTCSDLKNGTTSNNSYDNLLSRIDKCCFLFPTIQRMRVSPNGQYLNIFITYFRPLLVFFIAIICWLPTLLRTKIISWNIKQKNVDKVMIDTTMDLLTPRMFNSMLKLAHSEFCKVNSLEVNIIEAWKEKLIFYFGKNDGWCPLYYAEELQRLVPNVKYYIDDKNVDHAFVLKSSDVIAKIVAKLLNI